jgi:hypothetical protein
MKTSDIVSILGSFFLAFGAALMAQDVPKWAWWAGQGMVIAGPLLMGARAMAAKEGHKP